MDAQDFRSLQESYLEVIMGEGNDYKKKINPEKVGQEKPTVRKAKQNPSFFGNQKYGMLGTTNFGSMSGKMSKSERNMKKTQEQVDIYDIILSHLLDEGYAETPEAAEAIMVNMSEDWRDSIIG
jgi:hypothetical protein